MPECPMCPGVTNFMGFLGRRAHFRCLHCGIEFSQEVNDEDVADCDHDHDGRGPG